MRTRRIILKKKKNKQKKKKTLLRVCTDYVPADCLRDIVYVRKKKELIVFKRFVIDLGLSSMRVRWDGNAKNILTIIEKKENENE